MSSKTYELAGNTLIIKGNTGVKDYCMDYGITEGEFNSPVVIADTVTNCEYMFASCWVFNQPVVIPSSVTNCNHMFAYCRNFNKSISIPASVTDCEAMFNHCAVIGRNTAGTKLQFDNGLNYTGREVGFRYNSIKELTQSIETVIECKETELERMLDSAYKTVLHFYLKSKSAESVMKIYRNLLLK